MTLLSDLIFNHPIVCAFAISVAAYAVGGAVIVFGGRR